MAVVLAAMLAYGIAPGPQMLGRYADITIMLAVSFGIGNLRFIYRKQSLYRLVVHVRCKLQFHRYH